MYFPKRFKLYLSDLFLFVQGYQTVMSELGTQLSRGEKQTISLSRALVLKPNFLSKLSL